MDEAKFGVAESSGRVFALVQLAVECIHQLRRGGVADLPKRSDHVVRASSQKGPGEADQALSGIRACARPVARGDSHEVGVQAMLDDVSRIQLVSVTRGFLAEDDRGFQGTSATGGAGWYQIEGGGAAPLAAAAGAALCPRTPQNRPSGDPP